MANGEFTSSRCNFFFSTPVILLLRGVGEGKQYVCAMEMMVVLVYAQVKFRKCFLLLSLPHFLACSQRIASFLTLFHLYHSHTTRSFFRVATREWMESRALMKQQLYQRKLSMSRKKERKGKQLRGCVCHF